MIFIFLVGVHLMGHGTFRGDKERIDMMKVMKIEPNEKVVKFSKSETYLNEFCQTQPVSEFIRNEMEEVHRDLLMYMREQYFDEVQSIVKEFIDEHHPREEKRQSLENNLFWWKVLYESNQEDWNCTDSFVEENEYRFMDKPLIVSWLKEWGKAATKFYYVGYKYSDRVFFVIDILEDKMLNVVLKSPSAVSPKEGELVIGTLIPYGEELYSPVTDFYRFDYDAREVMGATFKFYYDKYLQSNSLSSSFIHVLSVMLKIERRIDLKIKRAK